MGYTHGTKWSDDKIKFGILEVVQTLELRRMPSRQEVEQYYNNSALCSAISRRKGGWYRLAEEMGLAAKESETYFGKRHEKIVAEKLKALGYEVEQMSQNYPYDLLIDRAVKIDVKVSRLYRGSQGNFYSFNLEKPYATCDIYILAKLDDDRAIKSFYVLPSKFVSHQTQISIGEYTSKYERFRERWDYLQQYTDFLASEVS